MELRANDAGYEEGGVMYGGTDLRCTDENYSFRFLGF
jgi:hypothetical protein